MNSKVLKLADLSLFEINPDLKTVNVTDEEVQAIIDNMASNMGKTVEVDAIEENCGVVCKTDAGEKIILYPSLQVPGAEAATEVVKDKNIGDTFTTVIKEKEITLTVEKILVTRSLAIDDELALASEIEGVSTLEELKAHLISSETEKKKEENVRMLVMDYVQFMLSNSEVEVDEKEVKEWAVPQAKKVYEEELSFGIDLRFTEDGEMISEEEALANLAKDLETQFIAMQIQKAFGEANGYVPSEEEKAACENPYDVYMFQTLTERAKEALS